MKRIGDDKSIPPPFKQFSSNLSNQDKTSHPPSDDGSQDRALDLSSKDKSIHKDMPPVAFTTTAHIYCPVKNSTTKELKRAHAILRIKRVSQKYRVTKKPPLLTLTLCTIQKRARLLKKMMKFRSIVVLNSSTIIMRIPTILFTTTNLPPTLLATWIPQRIS